MVASMVNCHDWKEANIILLGAPYDGTSSFGKGADHGPKAVIYCLNSQIEFLEPLTQTTPAYDARIAYCDLERNNPVPDIKNRVVYAGKPEQMVKKIEGTYRHILNENPHAFLILLGGEHTVSAGAFAALATPTIGRIPDDITIVVIDAHFDLRDDDSDYHENPFGKFVHSSVMRRALDMGFNTVHVGVRAFSKEEFDFAQAKKLPVFFWIPSVGKAFFTVPSLFEIIAAIPTKKVYLSIDIDGFDPSVMPATGTPVPGGLDWGYTLQLIRNLFVEKEVIGADIVEVAPRIVEEDFGRTITFPHASDRLTAFSAAQLCYSLIAFHRLDERR